MSGARPNPGLRSDPLPSGGMLEPPVGRAGSAALSIVLILGAGVGLWWARAPLAEALDAWALPASLPSAHEPASGDAATAPAAAAPATRATEPRVVEPEKPAWTLVRVAESVQAAGPAFEALIADGRAELAELDDPDSADEARAARTRAHWENWGRIWRNRVEAIAATLPPAESCAIHAAMGPACQALGQVRAGLAEVPSEASKDEAETRLDAVAAELDLFLNPPPEPEEETEEAAGEEAVGEGEAGGDGDQA